MRRIIAITALVALSGVLVVLGTGASDDDGGTYQVRAIFDNAFSLIEGEDVRVSGVNVGKITKLDVTDDNRAAVVMDIKAAGFDDFRQDAKCTIRPQSLIGEKYVECTLTQPRRPGAQAPPALEVIPDGEPGEGQRLLPVERTSKPVDIDLINNITRLPERQRLAIILNELGAGLAGRASDLNVTIRRANPALGATNEVLRLIGEQNDVLRKLATDSDAVLGPLARDRDSVAGFIENANTVSQATAERRADLERNFERLPRFLEELRPTMVRLQGFADEFEPVLSDLQGAAPDINRMVRALGPFSTDGIPAVESLGDALVAGRPALLRTKPVIDDLRRLTGEAGPLVSDLAEVTTSLRDSGGIERLMDYLFFQVAAVNGYDALGHYLRAGLIVNTCSTYASTPQSGCSARWAQEESDEARAAAARPSNVRRAFAADDAPGADHSAPARQQQRTGASGAQANAQAPEAGALKLPSSILPGAPAEQRKSQSAPAPAPVAQQAPSTPPDGATAAQQGMLDYLLGEGS